MVNPAAFEPGSLQFYMTFREKAHYAGPFDANGIPMLDYRGSLGRQYNPIAIAQYGLGCLNESREQGAESREQRVGSGEQGAESLSPSAFLLRARACADWLVDHLEPNAAGLPVWMHRFDWEYFQTLKAPWFSGLAQGQGIALLMRMHAVTGESGYRDAALRAFVAMVTPVKEGGTLFVDDRGDWWIEEYITDPPTHILNGMMWALWGVRDLQKFGDDAPVKAGRATSLPHPSEVWDRCVATLERNLDRFDSGYWSLYDLSPVAMRNVASPFYHRLHLVQLDVMRRLSGRPVFGEILERWQGYQARSWCRERAWLHKVLFKLVYF
jgi:hypothetical protein